MCCTLPAIGEPLHKAEGVPCRNLSCAGCAIYPDRPARPEDVAWHVLQLANPRKARLFIKALSFDHSVQAMRGGDNYADDPTQHPLVIATMKYVASQKYRK
jgi:hypothetical protein